MSKSKTEQPSTALQNSNSGQNSSPKGSFSTELAQLKEILQNHSDASKIGGMQAYMKNLFPYLGVTATQRKSAFKLFLSLWHPQNKEELKQWVNLLWQQPEREFQYMAMEFISKYIKWFNTSDIPFFKALVLQKSWWDTVDMLAGSYLSKLLLNEPQSLAELVQDFSGDANMWINRTAIICQLKFKEKTQTEWLEFAILPHIHSKEFFHQKAIGWALRQYAKNNPHWVIDFVNKYPLKPLSKREALKHL